jgi:hypothetical protein
MNWFQRHGIPGAYSLGLIIAWIWAIFPCVITQISLRDIGVMVGVFFLPMGYIIYTIQHLIYYNMCKGMWVYREARIKAGRPFPPEVKDDESSIEAYTLILISYKKMMNGQMQQHKFLAEWISRRMDVISINSSVLTATILAPIIASIYGFLSTYGMQVGWPKVGLLVVISIFIYYMMCQINKKLRNMIIEVVSYFYESY